jgi:hypothetical protein
MAIALPVFLLIGAFLLTSISCRNADILFSQATDQVTQEISLILPVVGVGMDVAESALGIIDHFTATPGKSESESRVKDTATSVIAGITSVLDVFGIEIEDQITTVILGKAIHDRIISVYQSYCADELLAARISDVGVYLDIDNAARVIWLRIYYRWQTLFGPCDRMIISAVPIYGDISLTLPDTKELENDKDSVWMMSNFERGIKLRSIFGANLPPTYPTIAIWSNGTATSIKSIDLTAPEYNQEGHLKRKVRGYITALARFQGTPNGFGESNIIITPEDIKERKIIIVIPENSPSNVYNELQACVVTASENNVQVQINRYGNSYRFVPKSEDE